MPYHEQVTKLRAMRASTDTPALYSLSVAQARVADLESIRACAGTPEPVARVTDRCIPGPVGEIPVRVYRPAGTGPFPVLIYLFGGGWVLGTIDTSDAICRSLTNAASCVTVAVGYRLAPEHKFPAAVEDCYAAACWVAEHADELDADAGRLAIGGDSAGGNLAAACTLLARDHSKPTFAYQLLVYPTTDYLSNTPSMRAGTDPYFFNNTSVAWYWQHYLADPEDGRNPLASPLRAADLSGLPPALVITAEHDPLRDEGEQYADRLRQAGVPVELTRYPGMVHGFFAMAGTLDAGAQALAQAAEHLRRALRRLGSR